MNLGESVSFAGVDLAHVGQQFGDRDPIHRRLISNGSKPKISASSIARRARRSRLFTRSPRIKTTQDLRLLAGSIP